MSICAHVCTGTDTRRWYQLFSCLTLPFLLLFYLYIYGMCFLQVYLFTVSVSGTCRGQRRASAP